MAIRLLPDVPNYGLDPSQSRRLAPSDSPGKQLLRQLEASGMAFGKSSPTAFPGAKNAGPSSDYPFETPERTTPRPGVSYSEPVTPEAAIGEAAGGIGNAMVADKVSNMIFGGSGPMTTGASAGSATLGQLGLGGVVDVGPYGFTNATTGLPEAVSATLPAEGGFLASAAPYAGAAGAAVGAYGLGSNLMDNKKDAMGGALSGGALGGGLGMAAPLLGMGPLGWGTIGLMALGGALGGGALGGLIGGDKDADQLQRDEMRKQLMASGLIDESYNVSLPNGQKYDLGRDGSIKTYQVQNAENPVVGQIVGTAQVLAGMITGKPLSKEATDLTGWLTNAAMTGAGSYYEAMENLSGVWANYASKAGLTPQTGREVLRSWLESGAIDRQQYDAFMAAHESLIDGRDWQFEDQEVGLPPAVPEAPAAPEAPAEQTGKLREIQTSAPTTAQGPSGPPTVIQAPQTQAAVAPTTQAPASATTTQPPAPAALPQPIGQKRPISVTDIKGLLYGR